ncbi:3-phosphoshikimate 1-carboxyvinyltransferase [Lapidilactobacillus bayanensis]|uniref:3-phosphoshikimate 1-carboxyvinyltransferase n=1 Tax=Lapidilactobacillus bayanensis TaxID=2485998 RepID=UPI0013DE5F7A|nr:3-phosphoshikimate 1-carboxyvinyltransferase [Lapidilactobacillus bayanensis]
MIEQKTIQQQFNDLVITPTQSLQGTYQTPSDKSISHRALIFGALAQGETVINRLLPSADVLRTKTALQQLGVAMTTQGEQTMISGQGGFNFNEPATALKLGNSGTTARIFLGLLAQQNFPITLNGDASLSQRPMDRVVAPLTAMGLQVQYLSSFDYLPLEILPGAQLRGLNYRMPIASAQLKSALILAALQAEQPSIIVQPAASRDHTELMLQQFGGQIQQDGLTLTVQPLHEPLFGQTLTIPGDPSTAAFFIAAALLRPNSRILIKNQSLNPTRTGFLQLLQQLNAPLTITKQTTTPESSGDVLVTSLTTQLNSLVIDRDNLGSVIDEIPIISLFATQLAGPTIIRDAQELRYKETDRLHVITVELGKLGAQIVEQSDGLIINGPTKLHRPESTLDAHQDHRIAMMLVVAELIIGEKAPIKGIESVTISNPTFIQDLISLLKDKSV